MLQLQLHYIITSNNITTVHVVKQSYIIYSCSIEWLLSTFTKSSNIL